MQTSGLTEQFLVSLFSLLGATFHLIKAQCQETHPSHNFATLVKLHWHTQTHRHRHRQALSTDTHTHTHTHTQEQVKLPGDEIAMANKHTSHMAISENKWMILCTQRLGKNGEAEKSVQVQVSDGLKERNSLSLTLGHQRLKGILSWITINRETGSISLLHSFFTRQNLLTANVLQRLVSLQIPLFYHFLSLALRIFLSLKGWNKGRWQS